jgi:DNA-binding NtrC family response regulator
MSEQHVTVSELLAMPSTVWTIEVVDERGARRLSLSEGESWVLGSGAEAGVQVHDPTVSAAHCRIGVRAGRFWVEDLGSRNGLYASGGRVDRAQFASGGCFVVGRAVIACAPCRGSEEDDAESEEPLEGVIGESLAMRRLARDVRRLAPLRAPVLIRGETGSGKELVAAAVHRCSIRGSRPFVPLNMGALPGELADAELFGHERGAFTGAVTARQGAFEAARGGTLFLDEIAELALPVQAKLLRALEGGEVRTVGSTIARRVDVRVVAATWAPLHDRVAQGSFREDLFHRLAVLTVMVPPLRERRGDILLLARAFLAASAHEVGERSLTPGALSRLAAYEWPGNVRELKNVMLRAAVLASDRAITAELVEQALSVGRPSRESAVVRAIDRKAQTRALLAAHQGNVSLTARALGVARSTVRAWTR